MKTSNALLLSFFGVIIISVILQINGFVNLKGEGLTKNLKVSCKGASNIDLKNLKSLNAQVNTAGAGNVIVYASNELNAVILGVGNIVYFGNPKTVIQSINGIGKINKGKGSVSR